MISSFLILFREGIEAALIVAIVLAYLSRKTQGRGKWHVWTGVSLAILASAVTAVIFQWLMGGFSGKAEEIFEGILMLIACGVLIYMVTWASRAAGDFKKTLTNQVDSAIETGQLWSLAILVFVAVFREGVETVLFLAAVPSSGGIKALAGSALGLTAAIAVGFAYFKTSGKMNIRKFFQITAILLILIAAGLGAHGIHELQEGGVVPIINEHVFDINPKIKYVAGPEFESSKPELAKANEAIVEQIETNGFYESKKYKPYSKFAKANAISVSNPATLAFHERGTIGSLAKALFGYNGNPSLLEMITYVSLLIGSGIIFVIASKPKT